MLNELLGNTTLWVAILSWTIAQLIKTLIDLRRNRKLNLGWFISSGGMPSSHSSFVTALATSIGLTEGFNTPIFAVSTVISLVVMYDAAGVRRAAGKQAEVINLIVSSLEDSGLALDKKLKELLGHSPIEVAAGALLGICVALVFG